MNYIFKSQKIALREMNDSLEDYKLITKWLSDPEILKYYGGRDKPSSLDQTISKYGPRIKKENYIQPCIMEYHHKAIGYLQFYETNNEAYEVGTLIEMEKCEVAYALDLFIGERQYWGMGIGTQLIEKMVDYLFKVKKADGIFIDPQTWNERAIQCYKKSGFKPIKVIEKRELHEGEYKDNLVMMISKEDI